MYRSYQDWKDIVITKPPSEIEKKANASKKPKPIARDEDGEPIIKTKIVTKQMGINVQKARNKKGWKRKDLAIAVQKNEKIIEELENGKGKLDHALIQKIEKVTGEKIF